MKDVSTLLRVKLSRLSSARTPRSPSRQAGPIAIANTSLFAALSGTSQRFREHDAVRACLSASLLPVSKPIVGGTGFAVDASLIAADATRRPLWAPFGGFVGDWFWDANFAAVAGAIVTALDPILQARRNAKGE